MERLANTSSRDGRMAPSTTNKNDLGVVTPVVTAERERDSFFCRDGFFSLCIRHHFSCQGILGVSPYF